MIVAFLVILMSRLRSVLERFQKRNLYHKNVPSVSKSLNL